jgi:hypothetical protein
MSTPHIVGIISLMLSYDPDLTNEDIKTLFTENQSSVQSESSKYIAG